MHGLWESHEWKSAESHEVVAALFDAPLSPHPEDMADIARFHKQAIAQYQQMFYQDATPRSVRKIRYRRIGM